MRSSTSSRVCWPSTESLSASAVLLRRSFRIALTSLRVISDGSTKKFDVSIGGLPAEREFHSCWPAATTCLRPPRCMVRLLNFFVSYSAYVGGGGSIAVS